MKWKVDLTECISFVRPKFKIGHLNDSNSDLQFELGVSKIHCIELCVTNIFFFEYNTITSNEASSLSFSTHTTTKTLHKKIWMKNICVC